MRNLNLKTAANSLFVVYAICFVLVYFFTGRRIVDLWSGLAVAYKAIPLLLGAIWVFVAFGWRWRIFRRWLVTVPDLNGTWQGTVRTTWKDPLTDASPGPIPVILTVKQSFTAISCVMRSAEMCSRSYMADFWINEGEQIKRLVYFYRSDPTPFVEYRSAPHQGTSILDVVAGSPMKLAGEFWSSRGTRGTIELTFLEKELLHSLPAGAGPHPVGGQ